MAATPGHSQPAGPGRKAAAARATHHSGHRTPCTTPRSPTWTVLRARHGQRRLLTAGRPAAAHSRSVTDFLAYRRRRNTGEFGPASVSVLAGSQGIGGAQRPRHQRHAWTRRWWHGWWIPNRRAPAALAVQTVWSRRVAPSSIARPVGIVQCAQAPIRYTHHSGRDEWPRPARDTTARGTGSGRRCPASQPAPATPSIPNHGGASGSCGQAAQTCSADERVGVEAGADEGSAGQGARDRGSAQASAAPDGTEPDRHRPGDQGRRARGQAYATALRTTARTPGASAPTCRRNRHG